jgi:hypothetical protein
MLSFLTLFAVLGLTPAALAADPPASCTGLTDSTQRAQCLEERLIQLELEVADLPAGQQRTSSTPSRHSRQFRWLVCQEASDEVCRDEWGADTVAYSRYLEGEYGCSEFAPKIDIAAALRGDPAQCRRGAPPPPAPAPKPEPQQLPSSDELSVERDSATGMKFTLGVPMTVLAYSNPEAAGPTAITTFGLQLGLTDLETKGKWGYSGSGGIAAGSKGTGVAEIGLSAIYSIGNNMHLGPAVTLSHWEVDLLPDYIVTYKGDGASLGAELRLVPAKHLSVNLEAGAMPYRISNGNDVTTGLGFRAGAEISIYAF